MQRGEFGHPKFSFEEKEEARRIQEKDSPSMWPEAIAIVTLHLPFVLYIIHTYITEGRLP